MATTRKLNPLPAPIFYPNYLNYAEIAAILIEKLNKLCTESKELSHVTIEQPFDINTLADKLYELFPEEMIVELMNSEFGQGILIGIWLDNMYGAQHSVSLDADEVDERRD